MSAEPHPLDVHRFTVRRRGYDPGEVDSILRRVADSLRRYEQQIVDLEERLEEAIPTIPAPHGEPQTARRETSHAVEEATQVALALLIEADAEAVRSAEEAAEQAREHIETARNDAELLLQRAHETLAAAEETAAITLLDANTVLELASNTAALLTGDADETFALAEAALDAARSEAASTDAAGKLAVEELLARARAETADVLAAGRREAEVLVTSAVREARDLRDRVQTEAEETRRRHHARSAEIIATAEREARETRDKARRSAADRVAAARAEADRLLEDAQREAETVVGDARREKLRLRQRIAELRGAVENIEQQVTLMASTTLDRTSVVHRMMETHDEIDSVDGNGVSGPMAMPEANGIERLTIDITDPDFTVSVTLDDLRDRASSPFAAPDGSGRPPAARGTIDPAGPPRFTAPTMEKVSGTNARSGRSLTEAIAASRRA